ncbi:MAG: AmmeMemoRadiSam system radical SAM enzyme [Spirochaetia bacterium]|nr:AmmeMemoRadiSam system radical SAM enzyme [Spirochaetia bacterium]
MPLREAKFWKKEPVNRARCVLCPHRCMITNNKSGICMARTNKDGVLYTKVYGELSSYAMDPIEKKPLYHFYPGTEIFSIGTWGCNLKCTFCQNWQISQQEVPTEHFEPADIVEVALSHNSVGVAYTYNEPFIWHEFVYDTAGEVRGKGLKNVLVTNGYVSEEPLKEMLPYIDAMNVDIKAGNDNFYREVCSGRLAPVMRTVKTAVEAGVHVELTNLVIPTLNDRDDIDRIVEWVAGISPDIPLHFSRYYPQYKMNIDPTEISMLAGAQEKARQKLKYVYTGNVPSESGGSDTECPKCKKQLIHREFYKVDVTGIKDGKCRHCGEPIAGRF